MVPMPRKVVHLCAGFLSVILLVSGVAVRGAASESRAAASAAPPARTQTVYLDSEAVGYTVGTWAVSCSPRVAQFNKEPIWSQGKVARGTLRFGNDRTNWLAFAWDQTAGRLYLDLNHNLDLTDDPTGVFVSRDRVQANSYVSFKAIRLPLKTASGELETLVDLNFSPAGGSANCTATLHLSRLGKLTLDDADWQVGLVSNPFENGAAWQRGQLLLRPWMERDRAEVNAPTWAIFPFPDKLWLQGHAFALTWAVEVQTDKTRIALKLVEQQPALGEVKVAGTSIQRLILKGGSYLVVADRPDAALRVPAGDYTGFDAWLRKGDVTAYCSALAERLTVAARKPISLAVGGPLTNTVSVSRSGRDLSLSYQLLGVGGNSYQLLRRDGTRSADPPEFTIYRSGRQIASDKFRFG